MPDLAREAYDAATRHVEQSERNAAAIEAIDRHYKNIARCECTGFCLRCRELLELIGDELKKALNYNG